MEKEPFFPPEVTGGAFKVTLTGRGRAWVEQHQGLLGVHGGGGALPHEGGYAAH